MTEAEKLRQPGVVSLERDARHSGECAKLAGEREPVAQLRPVERAHAVAIGRQREPQRRIVPDGARERSVRGVEKGRARRPEMRGDDFNRRIAERRNGRRIELSIEPDGEVTGCHESIRRGGAGLGDRGMTEAGAREIES